MVDARETRQEEKEEGTPSLSASPSKSPLWKRGDIALLIQALQEERPLDERERALLAAFIASLDSKRSDLLTRVFGRVLFAIASDLAASQDVPPSLLEGAEDEEERSAYAEQLRMEYLRPKIFSCLAMGLLMGYYLPRKFGGRAEAWQQKP